jgi:HlyD family secretion protein
VSRGKIIAGAVALVVILAVVGGVFYSSAASAPSVTTAKVTKQTLGVTVTASGKIEAANRADVFPPTAGTLDTVVVSDGQSVKAGDTLAVMAEAPLRLQVKQASAALKGAKAQRDAVNKGVPSAIDKSAAKAGVVAAKAAYDSAHSTYEAFRTAFGSDPSQEATLTKLALADKQAYAALQSAKSGSSKLTLAAKTSLAKASANASVDAASAALSYAESVLDDATLVAPMDGVVIFNAMGLPGADGQTPKAASGTAVAPGSAPFTVVDLSNMNFNAQVDEADISKVAGAMKAKVTLDAFPAVTFDGTVKSIRKAAIQTTTGGIAFPVLVAVNDAGKSLLVGMSGSVDIEVQAVADALTVPAEAILSDNSKNFVFVIGADNKVKKVEVTTGATTATSTEVLTGLSNGDTVATSQLTTLKDGMTVRPQ